MRKRTNHTYLNERNESLNFGPYYMYLPREEGKPHEVITNFKIQEWKL